MLYRFSRFLPAGALLCASLAHGVAAAHDHQFPNFSISGFGTLGVVHSDEDKADFRQSFIKPDGAGRSHSWTADVDSLIGGQLTANFTPSLSGILQVVAEQDYDHDFTPRVEWANLRYAITPDFDVRIGRTSLSTFMVSDYRKVGYAQVWLRPPSELYGLVPMSNNDGIEFIYRNRLGRASNSISLGFGENDAKLPENLHSESRRGVTFSDTLEIGATTLRASYHQGEVTIPELNQQFFSLYRSPMFGAAGAALADRYDVDRKDMSFVGFGASYDPGDWFLTGEWGKRKSNSFVAEQSAWYVSGGYRFGQFTPYLIYSRLDDDNRREPGLDPSISPLAGMLNARLNEMLRSQGQTTVAVGTRWDFQRNMALKLQYERIRLAPNSRGTLINATSDFETGGTVHLFSAALHFIF